MYLWLCRQIIVLKLFYNYHSWLINQLPQLTEKRKNHRSYLFLHILGNSDVFSGIVVVYVIVVYSKIVMEIREIQCGYLFKKYIPSSNNQII